MYSYFYIVVCGVVRRLRPSRPIDISKEHASYNIRVSQMSSMLRYVGGCELAVEDGSFVRLLRVEEGDPDDVPHCRILSPDKTEWRLISATLCR